MIEEIYKLAKGERQSICNKTVIVSDKKKDPLFSLTQRSDKELQMMYTHLGRNKFNLRRTKMQLCGFRILSFHMYPRHANVMVEKLQVAVFFSQLRIFVLGGVFELPLCALS